MRQPDLFGDLNPADAERGGLSTKKLGAWSKLAFFAEDFAKVEAALAADPRHWLPAPHQVFAALEACAPEDVKVVILGQDPYPTPGHAHGLAFSAEPETRPLPKSLANIYKELAADLGAAPPNADLRFWAAQGVLLLNPILTVPAGEAKGHVKIGWQCLTTQIIDHLASDGIPRVYMLWGKLAQKTASGVPNGPNLKIETAHPSPLSAYRGFFGSRPFSAANNWLQEQSRSPINWTDPTLT